jgi:hypothetical protein
MTNLVFPKEHCVTMNPREETSISTEKGHEFLVLTAVSHANIGHVENLEGKTLEI